MNLSSFVEANKEVISFINDWRCDDNINQQLEKGTSKLYFQNHPEIKYVGTLDYATTRFNTILLRLAEYPLTIDEHTNELIDCQSAIQHFYKNTKRLMTWPQITHPIIRWNLHGIGTRQIPKIKKLLDKIVNNIDDGKT